MDPILSLSHLKKYYSDQKAVDDISFDIKEGSIFGLLGPMEQVKPLCLE